MASTVFLVVELFAIILYSFLTILCLISFWKSFQRKESAITSRLFHSFIFLFVLGRTIWYILRLATGEGPITFTLNNLSFNCYVAGLLVILFYWIEMYHQTYVSSTDFFPKMKKIFIFLICSLFSIQILIFILFFTVNKSKREGSTIYLLNTIYQVILSISLGFSFLIAVVRIYLKYTSIDKDVCRNQLTQIRKMFYLSLAFCFCFLTRSIIFLYNPITGKYMNNEVFITLGYFVPDIIPTLLQVYIWHSRMRNEEEDSSFINSLYENEMDEETPTPTPVNDQMILFTESSPLVINDNLDFSTKV